jgi:hypothetical protein
VFSQARLSRADTAGSMVRWAQGPIVSPTSTPRSRRMAYWYSVCSTNQSCQPPMSRVGTVLE